jgi:type I site-specific restriction endonuclease
MADEPTPAAEETPAPAPDPTPDPAPDPDPKPDPEGKKPPWGDDFDPQRAYDTIQKLRATEAELSKKVKAAEDATKTDQEKLEERATGAEGRAQKAEADAARLRVALRKGLTETQAKRLVGESEEELEKDADELLESFKAPEADDDKARRRPTERLRPGAAPASTDEANDPQKLAEQVSPGW